MEKSNFDNIDFKRGLLVGNMKILAENIESFVNSDAGIRPFDVVLQASKGKTKRAELAAIVLKKILKNPTWNPNYRGPDMWHPEERAMIHNRQDVAIAVIKHPNFDKARLPQVISSAKRFGSKKVLTFLQKQHIRG